MVADGKAPPAVQLRGVSKHFGKVIAVDNIDLDIPNGSLLTLLGPSGCGKTTILRMIAGLETPTEGDIFIKGKRVNDTPIHKRNLGMIFQNYALFPHKTIFDNVAFGLKYRKIPKAEMRTKVKRALEIVRLPGVEKRMPSQLSGGQQQRIALARAIVIEPDVLLMDEPLSALDENLREEMRVEVGNLHEMLGITSIFVTHDQREALVMSDSIVVMNEGQKQQEGPPEEVYNSPISHFVADFIGHSNFFSGVITALEGERIAIKLDDGAELMALQPGNWHEDQRIEVVIRAQKFDLLPINHQEREAEANYFDGRIKARSYMGGEVRYFAETKTGTVVHIIGGIRSELFRRGDEVMIEFSPKDCHLLPRDNGS
jgi:putative spermidine/putrescine transport system ATP-binding protein/spermidine/putrescine transport system ATP-binding protein